MSTDSTSTDAAAGPVLTEGLGTWLRSAGVWVRHSHYAAAEPAGYVRDSAPFQAADVLDMQAREVAALRQELAQAQAECQRLRSMLEPIDHEMQNDVVRTDVR